VALRPSGRTANRPTSRTLAIDSPTTAISRGTSISSAGGQLSISEICDEMCRGGSRLKYFWGLAPPLPFLYSSIPLPFHRPPVRSRHP